MTCLHCKDNRPDVLTRQAQKAKLERVFAEQNMLKPGGFK